MCPDAAADIKTILLTPADLLLALAPGTRTSLRKETGMLASD